MEKRPSGPHLAVRMNWWASRRASSCGTRTTEWPAARGTVPVARPALGL